jgi:predicted CXXCH cytochrome family protein
MPVTLPCRPALVKVAVACLALACVKPAYVPYSDAEVAGVKSPHEFRGKPLCQACHQPGRAELKNDPVKLCQGCHSFHGGNHPIEVVQRSPAQGIPLLAGGRVACHSCHDPHDWKRNAKGLRFPADELCVHCHVMGGDRHHRS